MLDRASGTGNCAECRGMHMPANLIAQWRHLHCHQLIPGRRQVSKMPAIAAVLNTNTVATTAQSTVIAYTRAPNVILDLFLKM